MNALAAGFTFALLIILFLKTKEEQSPWLRWFYRIVVILAMTGVITGVLFINDIIP
ncbi:hypothetical protein KW786_02855 [Candidatus Parcubacteria bacterium]|nr:hypothetical protein [Candidatus Parcubacteria bacterium]